MRRDVRRLEAAALIDRDVDERRRPAASARPCPPSPAAAPSHPEPARRRPPGRPTSPAARRRAGWTSPSGSCRARSDRRTASRSTFLSTIVTSASMPAAIYAAFVPAMPGAEDDHVRRRDTRRAAHQHPSPALRPLQVASPRNAAPSGRRSRTSVRAAAGGRRAAARSRTPPPRPALGQEPGERLVGRQVQVGEQELAVAEPFVLRRLRLLHLDDQVAAAKTASASARISRARRREVGVGERRADRPRPASTTTECPRVHELAHPFGGRGDPVLVVLHFRRDPDDHARAPSLRRKAYSRKRPDRATAAHGSGGSAGGEQQRERGLRVADLARRAPRRPSGRTASGSPRCRPPPRPRARPRSAPRSRWTYSSVNPADA